MTPSAIYFWATLPVLVILYQWYAPRPDRPKGCRKLGLGKNQSNLRDEYDVKYSQENQDQPSWRIKALFTYPIKSCAGVELDIADVVPTGLAYDRQFCFAEYIIPRPGPDGAPPPGYWTARTQRDGEFSKMALIRPEIWVPDPSAPDYSPDLDEVQSHGVMLIHYPRVPAKTAGGLLTQVGIALRLLSKDLSFRVPLVPPTEHTYPCPPVKIWKDTPPAYDYGQHLPASLRQFLLDGHPSRRGPLTLFRVHPAHHREIFRCAPRKESVGFQTVTGFADAYPLHLLNLASVRDVAARCATEIPFLSVRRFRANLIVQGGEAFAEDCWKRIRVGPYSLSRRSKTEAEAEAEAETDIDTGSDYTEIYTSCRTMRCKLPNVDPDTGVRHRSEPDRTLKSYRRIDVGDLTNAALGMQLVPVPREFTMRVGDAVEVLETGEHCYIKMLAPGETVEGV